MAEDHCTGIYPETGAFVKLNTRKLQQKKTTSKHVLEEKQAATPKVI